MSRRPQKFCVVRAGLDDWLLPMADGVRLMDLLSSAVRVDRDWRGGKETFCIRQGVDGLRLDVVGPDQIVEPDALQSSAPRRGPRLITQGE